MARKKTDRQNNGSNSRVKGPKYKNDFGFSDLDAENISVNSEFDYVDEECPDESRLAPHSLSDVICGLASPEGPKRSDKKRGFGFPMIQGGPSYPKNTVGVSISGSKNPTVDDGIEATADEIKNFEAWGFCLVGYIAGRFPGRDAIIQLSKSWNVETKVCFSPRGWIIFEFLNDIDRKQVLSGGPYLIFGKKLIFKEINSQFDFKDEEVHKVPIWVRILLLPLHYWTDSLLGKIGAKFGKMLSFDPMPDSSNRFFYARMLVEVDLSKELVEEVKIKLPEGIDKFFDVQYEYMPLFCSCCKCFGHKVEKCKGRASVLQRKQGAKASKKISTVQDDENLLRHKQAVAKSFKSGEQSKTDKLNPEKNKALAVKDNEMQVPREVGSNKASSSKEASPTVLAPAAKRRTCDVKEKESNGSKVDVPSKANASKELPPNLQRSEHSSPSQKASQKASKKETKTNIQTDRDCTMEKSNEPVSDGSDSEDDSDTGDGTEEGEDSDTDEEGS